MVQCKPRPHQGDGDGVNAHVHPTRVLNAEPEVEGDTGEQAPCSEGSLSSTDGKVVEGGPSVVVDKALEPSGDVASLTDGLQSKGDHGNACDEKNRVAQGLEVETIDGVTKGSVGGFKRQQSSPRYMLVRQRHAEHVEESKENTPCAHEDHGRSVNRNWAVHFFRGVRATNVVAHAIADWSGAFKHTEGNRPRPEDLFTTTSDGGR